MAGQQNSEKLSLAARLNMTSRDLEIGGLLFASTPAETQIDYDKLAQLAAWKNKGTARVCARPIIKKLRYALIPSYCVQKGRRDVKGKLANFGKSGVSHEPRVRVHDRGLTDGNSQDRNDGSADETTQSAIAATPMKRKPKGTTEGEEDVKAAKPTPKRARGRGAKPKEKTDEAAEGAIEAADLDGFKPEGEVDEPF